MELTYVRMTVSLKWFSLNFDFLKLRWKDKVIFYQPNKKPYHTCLLFLYYCFLCISKWEQTIFYLNLIFVIKNIVWIKSLCFYILILCDRSEQLRNDLHNYVTAIYNVWILDDYFLNAKLMNEHITNNCFWLLIYT